MKIVFLLDNAYGIGGTIRSTVNLSGALAERHQVEVVSLRRSRQEPALAFDPRVTLTSLIDLRRSSPHCDGTTPTTTDAANASPRAATTSNAGSPPGWATCG